MDGKRIRVAVIDDHRVFAEALASRLSNEPALEVAGTAAADSEGQALFSRTRIDVVSRDLDLAAQDVVAVWR